MAEMKVLDDLSEHGESEPRGPKARSRQGQETLDRILDAALSVFARFGLRGSRLEQIAEEAGLSKTNLLYYVSSKQELYVAALRRILTRWLEPLEALTPESDPKSAIENYIARKLSDARDFPESSRLFALEIIQGAPHLNALLQGPLSTIVAEKAAIMRGWMAAGRMGTIDPEQYIFMIWATTQHHADFAVQTRAVAGAELSDPAFFERTRKALTERLTAGLF
jgi:TetR/AcrR family transcriptional regulator